MCENKKDKEGKEKYDLYGFLENNGKHFVEGESFKSAHPLTLLNINSNTFTFNGVLYRVKTCSWDSKAFRNIYYPEIFWMVNSGSNL